MNKEQILKAAIEKAEGNGYSRIEFVNNGEYPISSGVFARIENGQYIYFDKEFAKAFWGEERNIDEFGHHDMSDPRWACALMDMVLEEDPILYLEQFLTP